MADQKNRGGQKQSHWQPGQSERKQGTATRGPGSGPTATSGKTR
jgi:hypothetical protein